MKKVVNMHSMVMVFTDPEEEGNVHFELHVCEQWGMVTDYDENDIPLVKAYKVVLTLLLTRQKLIVSS